MQRLVLAPWSGSNTEIICRLKQQALFFFLNRFQQLFSTHRTEKKPLTQEYNCAHWERPKCTSYLCTASSKINMSVVTKTTLTARAVHLYIHRNLSRVGVLVEHQQTFKLYLQRIYIVTGQSETWKSKDVFTYNSLEQLEHYKVQCQHKPFTAHKTSQNVGDDDRNDAIEAINKVRMI